MKQHVSKQLRSAWHRIATLYVPLIIFLGYFNPKHWRPFLAGFIFYGACFVYIYKVPYLILPSTLYPIEPFLFAFLGFLTLRQVLVWQYRHGYTSKAALSMMGSVPLILVSFMLPFLKLHVDMFLLEGKMGAPFSETTKTVPQTKTEFVDPHYVRGYYRADGTYVEGYWRDGDGDTSIDLTKEEGGGYIRRRNL